LWASTPHDNDDLLSAKPPDEACLRRLSWLWSSLTRLPWLMTGHQCNKLPDEVIRTRSQCKVWWVETTAIRQIHIALPSKTRTLHCGLKHTKSCRKPRSMI
jgi:hypothetical protein